MTSSGGVVAQQVRRRGMPEDMPRRQSLGPDAGSLDRGLRDRRTHHRLTGADGAAVSCAGTPSRHPRQAGHGGCNPGRAAPTSCGSGKTAARRDLPLTRTTALSQSISFNRRLATSPARRASRARSSRMARSPQSHGRRPVAGCDDAFDVVPRQMTRQCREPLKGNRRHLRRQAPGRQRPSSTRKRRYSRSADVSRRTRSRDAVSRRHCTVFLISVALYRSGSSPRWGSSTRMALWLALYGPSPRCRDSAAARPGTAPRGGLVPRTPASGAAGRCPF